MEEPKKIRVTWDEYNDLIERLVARVTESGWEFDSLLCLARGGMRVGDVFSRVYNIPLSILIASSYREDAGKVQGDLTIANFITGQNELHGRVLLVDDLADSGVTLDKVAKQLKTMCPKITELRTAVIWVKERSIIQPDYSVVNYETNPWIIQPFEKYDARGAKEHLAYCKVKFGGEI